MIRSFYSMLRFPSNMIDIGLTRVCNVHDHGNYIANLSQRAPLRPC